MKNIILILATTFVIVSCSKHPNKYKILANGTSYFTNDYKKVGNCINFKKVGCDCNSQDQDIITICDAYTIQEFKDYKNK